jgi:circadian clock protein KaiB
MTRVEQQLPLAHFQEALAALETGSVSLTLFVSGASESSAHAIANVREICDAHLSGRHQLNIVDLHQEPALAEQHNILATPTLVRDHPLPLRMLVGDMSDHARVLLALNLPTGAGSGADPPGVTTARARP